jgi:hypothetical protein
MLAKLAFIAGSVVLIGGSAHAQTMLQQGFDGACRADAAALCSSVQPGEGRIVACLTENADKLSKACQGRIARAATVARACSADRETLCGSVTPGQGRLTRCMRDNVQKLSPDCRTALGLPENALAPAVPSGAVKLTIDMGKVKCGEALDLRPEGAALLVAWFSGFRHGKDGSTLVDMTQVDEVTRKVVAKCSSEPDSLLMDALTDATK